MQNYRRMFMPPSVAPESEKGSPLTTNVLYKHVQVPPPPASPCCFRLGAADAALQP